MKERIKAIGLLSGGLDSRLAVKIAHDQGIEVIALNFVTPFCNCSSKGSCKSEAKKASEEFGIELKIIPLYEEFMEVVKKPRYGYGSGINPCLDCRILMFRRAKQYMKELGASFVLTGEVLGERPMSQRLDAIRIIERDSGLSGLIVRPLSAQLFDPSIPEQKGWMDRDQLMNISGRSRKPQIKLAEELDIGDYPCPAGGCLLTDKDFAAKLRCLLAINPDPSRDEVLLLKVGRHFAGESGCQIIVGRDERENNRIEQLVCDGDWVLEARDWLGPITVVRGQSVGEADLDLAARLTARYGKGRSVSSVAVVCKKIGKNAAETVRSVSPSAETLVAG